MSTENKDLIADFGWSDSECCYYIKLANGVVIRTARSDLWDRLVVLVRDIRNGSILITTEAK